MITGIHFVKLDCLGDYVIVVKHDSNYDKYAVRVEGAEEAPELRTRRNDKTLVITGTGCGLTALSAPRDQPGEGQSTIRTWHNGVVETIELVNGIFTTIRWLQGRERQPKITVTINPDKTEVYVDSSPMPYQART